MEDKKIKIVNIIFLIFTIIYTLYSFIFSFNIYSEGLIFGIGTRLYLIGFIIFAICQIRNEKKEIGLKIFTISTIIATTLTILNVIIYILSPYGYAFLEFIEAAVMIVDIAQKIVLTIVLILIFKQKSSRILGYILLGITFILNIVMLCQEITIDYCLLAVVKGYIAVYIYYFEKGISKNSFRNIILIIVVEFLIILSFISSVTWIPKISYNSVVQKLQQIDSINANNINTLTRSIKYNNRKTISYEVSQFVKEKINNGSLSMYDYDDNITVALSIQELNNQQVYEMEKNAENFIVQNKEFYIIPSTSYNGMAIHTKIQNNLYCIITIIFENKVSLNEKDLQNLKPFFYINVK